MSTSNATVASSTLVDTLAASKYGSFTGLIIRKEGQVRGRGTNKRLYGDDLVHVCIVTGFKYLNLVKKSLDTLNGLDLDTVFASISTLRDRDGFCISRSDFDLAVVQTRESLQSTLDGTNSSTTDHVYEPLVVTSTDPVTGTVTRETVRGARVYTGTPESGINAAEPGTIYLQGIQISSTILEAAANGPVPQTKSGPVVVAKNAIRRLLPINRYVSYKLAPTSEFILQAGHAAALACDAAGMQIREASVREVFSLAE